MKTSPILLTLATAALFGVASLTLHAQTATPRTGQPAASPKAEANSTPKPRSSAKHSRTPSAFDENSKSTVARVKFSDPSKPGTLKFSLPWAEVRIVGTDGDEVVVSSTLDRKKEKGEVDADGFRRLDEDVSFELTEKDNIVGLSVVGDHHWMSHGAEFRIQVPRNTHLMVRTQAGGDIRIDNIDGDIDVNCTNGEVRLTDIGSSAVVNTMNGEVTAVFRQMPTKPISITSMNGEIDVSLPSETKANVRLRTHNGSVRTNFSEERLATKTDSTARRIAPGAGVRVVSAEEAREVQRVVQREVSQAVREAAIAAREAARAASLAHDDERGPAAAPAAPMPPVPAFAGGKSIVGTLNGGGIDISLSTMNGTITLREAKR